MTTIELIGDLRGTLDTYSDVPMPLTFSLANIKEPGKRSGLYSKTILLPGTTNNNTLLSYYFDVNLDTTVSTFNVYRKQGVRLLQDGVAIYDNLLLKLLRVNKRQNTQTGEDFVEYEVEIKDYSSDFFNQIAGKKLEDINMSEFNHTMESINIVNSWDHTWEDGYVYPLTQQDVESMYTLQVGLGTTDNVINANPLRLMIYAKQLFDKIHKLSGYEWIWENNDWVNVNFDKLLISDNKNDKLYVNEINSLSKIKANSNTYSFSWNSDDWINSGGSIKLLFPITFQNEIQDPGDKLKTRSSEPWVLAFPNPSPPPTSVPYKFENITNSAPGTGYPPQLETNYSSQFTLTTGQPIKITINGSLTTIIENLRTDFTILWASLGLDMQTFLNFRLHVKNQSTNTNYERIIKRIYIQDFGEIPASSNSEIVFDYSEIFEINEGNINNLFVFYITCDIGGSGSSWVYSNGFVPLTCDEDAKVTFIYKQNIEISYENIPYQSSIPVNASIPRKITQRELLDSIIKMYNLYVYSNPDNPRQIIYEQRDKFYDKGEVKDWTSKLARDREQIIEFLPDLTSKSINFTYKTDEEDLLNKSYVQATKEVWGKQTVDFSSEWVRGTQDVELIFGPSPIDNPPLGLGRSFPYIDYDLIKNPKIMIYSKKTETEYPIRIWDTQTLFTRSEIPYISHQNDELNPGFDLNFGINDFYFEEGVVPSDLNLYTFWRRTMKQIDTARQMTAYFNLTPLDIANLKLNDKILIDNSYWIISEVTDYDANIRQLTKVFLLSVEDEMKLF